MLITKNAVVIITKTPSTALLATCRTSSAKIGHGNVSHRKLSSCSSIANRNNNKNIILKRNYTFKLIQKQQAKSESSKTLNWLTQPQREKDVSNDSKNIDLFKSTSEYMPFKNSNGSYYHEKVILGFSREQMCDLVFNVSKYKEFVPFCANSEILAESKPANSDHLNLKKRANTAKLNLIDANKEIQTPKSFKAKLEIGFPPIKESYTSHVSMIRPNLVKAISRDTSLFEYLINEWKFHPVDLNNKLINNKVLKQAQESNLNLAKEHIDNSCIVEFYVSFKFHNIVYAKLSEVFIEKMFKKMVAAFTNRAQFLYGKPSVPPIKLKDL